MNGFTMLALIVLAIGIVVAYRAGAVRARRKMRAEAPLRPAVLATPPLPASGEAPVPAASAPVAAAVAADEPSASPAGMATGTGDALAGERFRLLLSYEAECAALRLAATGKDAELVQLRDLAADRRALHGELAAVRGEAARYRQIMVDIENNAPPPLLDGPGAPDDLKLIVGVGPVLERMLQQLGIATYRQIARWTERDIDEFDAKLPEFHGRVRRDGWVTQARALHQSKYGEPPTARG